MTAQQINIAYITGTSSGIGKALALKLLNEGFQVIGLSRKNEIEHENFKFQMLDLSNPTEVEGFRFENYSDANVLLVNNAGVLGEIGPVGKIGNQSISNVIQVNVTAPEILMNKFISTFNQGNGNYHIANISSGAGKYPIESWATYCSSKSALDLFSQTLKTEFEVNNMSNWSIHSIAPGVVDTNMQSHIRSANQQDFSMVQKFIDYKEKGELFTPQFVAQKLYDVIRDPKAFPDVLLSVRDL